MGTAWPLTSAHGRVAPRLRPIWVRVRRLHEGPKGRSALRAGGPWPHGRGCGAAAGGARRRELEKDESLANESWERFLPTFKKSNSKRPKKKVKAGADKVATPFPPAQTPRKVDLQLESGEYFLSQEQKRARELERRSEQQAEGTKASQASATRVSPTPAPRAGATRGSGGVCVRSSALRMDASHERVPNAAGLRGAARQERRNARFKAPKEAKPAAAAPAAPAAPAAADLVASIKGLAKAAGKKRAPDAPPTKAEAKKAKQEALANLLPEPKANKKAQALKKAKKAKAA